MRLPRRRFLVGLPLVMAPIAVCSSTRPVVNVRDFGATGNGIADDSAAIRAAAAALKSGSTLFFPEGAYRFAERNPPLGAAIAIIGVSDFDIVFDHDAELVMDNVDPATNKGTSHGILIRGPASRIGLRNVKVRWLSRANRSTGDGIRIVGCPTDTSATPTGWIGPPTPVKGVQMSDCEISSSPQTGSILIGVSDVSISGLRVLDTAADGLHFNACRRVEINDYVGEGNGDDGLALVTYFSDVFYFDRAAETFAFPDLTNWSNADFTITNVKVRGGLANGARFAGANRVAVSDFTVSGKSTGSGVAVDSATVESDPNWHYVASRGVRLRNLSIDGCSVGVQVLARPPHSRLDPRFTDFEVDITDAKISDCSNWSVQAQSLSEQRLTGITFGSCSVAATSTSGGNGGIGLENTQDISFGETSIVHSRPVTAFFAGNSRNLRINRLAVTIGESRQHETGDVPAPGAHFQRSDGVVKSMDVTCSGAPDSWTPVVVTDSVNCGGDSVTVDQPALLIERLTVDPSTVKSRIGSC